jgi:hypothetical protein
MSCQPVTGSENLDLDPFGGVPVLVSDDPLNGIEVFASLRG